PHMLPSSEWKPSAPAMSDLSWFNPTPHAIAVYASRPLSPVAAQHSLPSGRYSLLGPDFQRLDRTSLRLAHSFNHFVGAGEQCWRHGEAERLGSWKIDHELKLGRKLHWQIARRRAVQDLVYERGATVETPAQIDAVTDQAAVIDGFAPCVDRRQSRRLCPRSK